MAIVDKIAALLAMAERTNYEAEAEAFYAKAQELATHHSIDLALARAATAKLEAREQPTSRSIVIGALRQHSNRQLIELMLAVGRVNDLQMDIAHNSTYVIAFGMPSDIDVAEAMFNSIAVQMMQSGAAWLRSGEWRGETYEQWYHDGRGREWAESRLVTARIAKSNFYNGFIARISQRLQTVRDDAVATRVAAPEPNPLAVVSTAVVLREKAAEVKAFHQKNSKARGAWGGFSGNRTASHAALAAGRSAADRARITAQAELEN